MYLSHLRFSAAQSLISEKNKRLPFSPLYAAFVHEGERQGVGREALSLACLLASDAATFLPQQVATEWAVDCAQQGSGVLNDCSNHSAAGQVGSDAVSAAGHVGCDALVQLCRVLEDLEAFLKSAERQLDSNSNGGSGGARGHLLRVKVSVRKLRKAARLWWKADPEGVMQKSDLPDEQLAFTLIGLLETIHPENVATRVGQRWFAAGHRVRGDGLECLGNQTQASIFNPKADRYRKAADHSMSCLKPLLCVPMTGQANRVLEDVVIISDSTLNLPGVIYGLCCELRRRGLNLLWIATISGAGMQELHKAWKSAPPCRWGLTVANLNDAMKNDPWCVTHEALEFLHELLRKASEVCTGEHALFVNNASFYPDLRPSVYPELVRQVTEFVRTCEARVIDGEHYINRVKLRDSMHFAAESTEIAVQMYIEAILQMKNGESNGGGKGCESARGTSDSSATISPSSVRTRSPSSSLPLAPSPLCPRRPPLASCSSRSGLGSGDSARNSDASVPNDSARVPPPPGLPPRSNAQFAADPHDDERCYREFMNRVHEVQRKGYKPVKIPACISLRKRLPFRSPATLPPGDNRFDVKAKRVFVCDRCRNIVRLSSTNRGGNFHRIHCDFAGSYRCNDWRDIPGELQELAWQERLIDATWHCTGVCGAPMTGNNREKRLARTKASCIEIAMALSLLPA